MKQFLGEHSDAVTLQVDAGGVFDPRVREPQNERVMWQAIQEIGVDVLNLAPGDAAVLARLDQPGGKPVAGPIQRAEGALASRRPQLLTANVFGPGRKPLAPAYVVRRAADGTRLVLVGVSESRPGGHFGYLVEDPREALARLLPTIRTEGSVVVLLAYMPGSEAAELARAVKGLDIIVSGHEDEFAIQPYQSDAAWVLQAQYEGRFLGCVQLRLPAPGRLLDFERQVIVTLDGSIPDDPRVAALLEQRQVRPPAGVRTP